MMYYQADPIVHIDLSKSKTDRQSIAIQLTKALQEEGFAFLDNVKGFNPDELLEHTKWFFTINDEEKKRLTKRAWNPESQNCYRGFSPVQAGHTSWKELFEFGCELEADDPDCKKTIFYETNVWPKEDGGSPFQDFMKNYHKTMSENAVDIARLIALGLGMNENVFDEMLCSRPLSTARLLRYPPRPKPIPEYCIDGDDVITTGDHVDSSFITLLSTFDFGGLQMLGRNGDWVNIPPRRDCLVMNIGETLRELVGGRLKATRHRVVDLRDRVRYSVPFFVEPHFYANVGCPLVEPVEYEQKRTKPIAYGHYMIEKLKLYDYPEYRNTKFMLED